MKQTSWKLFTSNEDAWNEILVACENAEKSIDLEQFIFVADDFGNRLINICERKAKQGVKVRFLWDAVGSFSFFGEGIIEKLKAKGIELVFFKTLFPSFFKIHEYKSWYFRNHRRTLIIDGEIGFTGSICVYEKMKDWRDTNVMIKGLVVQDMRRSFERMWMRAHKKKLPKHNVETYSNNEFKYVTSSPMPRHRRLYSYIVEAIRDSKEYIYITTPYFVPTRRFARVLMLAAHRGIDVRIIIPEKSDHPIVDLASRTFFHHMLKSGVKIFLYKGIMLHSKTIIVDGDWASIGTLNIDNVSLLYNFEANLITTNRKFAEELVNHFEHDILHTQEITYDNWRKRYWVEKIAGFFIRFIRDFL